MSNETDIARLQTDLQHLTTTVNTLVESHKVQDQKLDRIIDTFTLGRSISSFLVKFCLTVGTIATAVVYFFKELLPLLK